MRDMPPLTGEEYGVLEKVCEIINRNTAVACTGCRYCVEHCPMGIAIPDCFAMLNEHARAPQYGWKVMPAYQQMILRHARAASCVQCGACAAHCPQRLPIPEYIKKVSEIFDK